MYRIVRTLLFGLIVGVGLTPGSSRADDLKDRINGIWDVIPDSPWNRGERVAWVHYTSYGQFGVGSEDGQRFQGPFEIVDDNTIRMETQDGTFEEAQVFISGDYMLIVEETEITEFRRRPPP